MTSSSTPSPYDDSLLNSSGASLNGQAGAYQAWVVPQRGQSTDVETSASNFRPQPQL